MDPSCACDWTQNVCLVLVWFQNAAYVTFFFLTAAYFLFVVPRGLFVALAVSRSGACHILYCHRHSLMLLYLPMPIHCAVMPNALLSYVSPRLSTAQKGCFALSCMAWHDQAQGLLEREMLQCKALQMFIYPVAALNCCLPISWPGCLFLVFIATFIHSIVSTAGLWRKSRLV